MKKATGKTVNGYLSTVSPDQRKALEQIRSTIKKLVPDAEEKISYNMPMFYLDGMFVAYAAFKNHCSFFPCSGTTLRHFSKELSSYKTSAGTIQFTIDHPIPVTLLKKIITARIGEIELRRTATTRTNKSVSQKNIFSLPPKTGKPVERALANAKITTLKHLSKWSEQEIAKLHGVGPRALRIFRASLKTARLSFKANKR